MICVNVLTPLHPSHEYKPTMDLAEERYVCEWGRNGVICMCARVYDALLVSDWLVAPVGVPWRRRTISEKDPYCVVWRTLLAEKWAQWSTAYVFVGAELFCLFSYEF